MFLELSHTKLKVYVTAREMLLECYRQTKYFPPEERYALTRQIRRASLSVHLNIAEGCCRRTYAERRRFFEISRSSLVEVDAAFDIASKLEYTSKEKLSSLGVLIIDNFKMLSKMIDR